MLITILTTGTRGDTQPFLALGLALKKKGHRVRIAASEGFKDFIEDYGLEFAATRGDVAKIASSDLVKDAVNADNPLKFFKSMKNEKLESLFLDMQHDLHKACHGSDVILYHPGATIGYFVAQEMNIPSVLATPFPMTPTKEYANLLFYNGIRLGKTYNKLTHKIFEQGFWMMTSSPLKKYWIKTFGKAPKNFSCPFTKQRTEASPTVTSCSPLVFDRPIDCSENVHYEGYWFLDCDDSYQPPEDLKSFLESGEPPVYVGFGSVIDKDNASQTTAMVMEALKRAGKRGILATGWNGMEIPKDISKDIFFIKAAPHDWLFPKMAAVVHHGGAGTTAAGLRAGVPGLIIPYGNDQFAWGRRIYELGVGAKAIPRKQLTAENLAEAISYTQNCEIKKKAKELGKCL